MTDHIDYKTASIDESFPVATAILFGADHQDTATPGPFEAYVIADAFDARESTLTNKTLVTPQIAAIYNGAYTYDMPAGTGTLARLEDIGAGSYTSPMTARGEMLRRGASADERLRSARTAMRCCRTVPIRHGQATRRAALAGLRGLGSTNHANTCQPLITAPSVTIARTTRRTFRRC